MSLGYLIAGIAALAATVFVAAVVIKHLTIEKILSWFRGRQQLSQGDRNKVGFSILKELQSGNFTVVQGIYDKSSDNVLETTEIEAENVDQEVKRLHRQDGLAVYTLN